MDVHSLKLTASSDPPERPNGNSSWTQQLSGAMFVFKEGNPSWQKSWQSRWPRILNELSGDQCNRFPRAKYGWLWPPADMVDTNDIKDPKDIPLRALLGHILLNRRPDEPANYLKSTHSSCCKAAFWKKTSELWIWVNSRVNHHVSLSPSPQVVFFRGGSSPTKRLCAVTSFTQKKPAFTWKPGVTWSFAHVFQDTTFM